jgi:hypothetical protein
MRMKLPKRELISGRKKERSQGYVKCIFATQIPSGKSGRVFARKRRIKKICKIKPPRHSCSTTNKSKTQEAFYSGKISKNKEKTIYLNRQLKKKLTSKASFGLNTMTFKRTVKEEVLWKHNKQKKYLMKNNKL